MSSFKITRRELLGAAAVTTAFAGVALARETSLLSTAGREAHAEFVAAGENDLYQLAWLDGMLSAEDSTRARATLAPLEPTILEPDLLWHWRRDLAQELGKGVRAVAITRWDKAILLSGLAREARLPVRQRRIGRSLFQTELG